MPSLVATTSALASTHARTIFAQKSFGTFAVSCFFTHKVEYMEVVFDNQELNNTKQTHLKVDFD